MKKQLVSLTLCLSLASGAFVAAAQNADLVAPHWEMIDGKRVWVVPPPVPAKPKFPNVKKSKDGGGVRG